MRSRLSTATTEAKILKEQLEEVAILQLLGTILYG